MLVILGRLPSEGEGMSEEHTSGLDVVADHGHVPAGAVPLAFEDFYSAELPRLMALARGLCGPILAEDIAQEAMLVAFRRWESISDLDRPEQWVRRACANLAVSQFRRRVIELRAVARLSQRRPVEPLSDSTEAFWSALRRLPSRQAQAAALRYVYELPVSEIAATMGCSKGSVKQHLSRARQVLAGQLGLDAEEER
jgi:RNA polymerase sigma-70 factor (ECF subfamily)